MFVGEVGYIGFNGSYGGRFYDGGYAGITITKNGKERNYPLEAYKNVIAQLKHIQGIEFINSSYEKLEIPKNSIIYCDIPYENSKEYKSAKNFNKIEFCNWARKKSKDGHKIFISEYIMPNDFKCIWEKEVSSSLKANGIISGDKKSIERLFTIAN